MVIDQHPFDFEDGGEGVDILYHEMGIEINSYDRRSDERKRHHQCKLCHVKEHGEESFYYDEISMAKVILNKVEESFKHTIEYSFHYLSVILLIIVLVMGFNYE